MAKISGTDLVYLAMEGADYLVPEQMNYGMKLVPQLGFQYLSAALKAGGYTCNIFDQPILGFSPTDLLSRLDKHPDRALGFYTDSFLKPKVIAWIRKLRELGFSRPILVGGPGSFGAVDYLRAGADLVAHGEGERTILQIMEYLNRERTRDQLAGVSWLENSDRVDTPAQTPIDDLDSIAFPDRDEYPIELYHDFHMFPMRVPFAGMLTSRGCPNQCTFCASPGIWGRRVRTRSVENVLEEIDLLVQKYGVKFVGFKDDVFALKRPWLEGFCEGLIRRNYDLSFSCNIHPFSFKNRREESIDLLARAGCKLMVAGLQSADPKVLENINRGKDEPEMLGELCRIIKSKQMALVAEFIFGLPGDSRQSWQAASDWAARHRPHYALFYSLSKLEGSVIGDQYQGKAVTEFSEAEIRKACADAQRKFFTHPATLLQDISFVLRNNPRWFFYVLKNLPYLIGALGIKGKGGAAVESRAM